MVWYVFVGWNSLVWGGGQMTSKFIHEEMTWMTGMDDWHG